MPIPFRVNALPTEMRDTTRVQNMKTMAIVVVQAGPMKVTTIVVTGRRVPGFVMLFIGWPTGFARDGFGFQAGYARPGIGWPI